MTASPSCHPSRLRMDSSHDDPHLMDGSLDPYESAPNSISISSAVFAGLTNVTNRKTHRQTDHATLSIAIGHILCTDCMRCGLMILVIYYIPVLFLSYNVVFRSPNCQTNAAHHHTHESRGTDGQRYW